MWLGTSRTGSGLHCTLLCTVVCIIRIKCRNFCNSKSQRSITVSTLSCISQQATLIHLICSPQQGLLGMVCSLFPLAKVLLFTHILAQQAVVMLSSWSHLLLTPEFKRKLDIPEHAWEAGGLTLHCTCSALPHLQLHQELVKKVSTFSEC